ncbi:hypothetical protein P692DRAFT_20739314, partial [Suillus brevipes Sb2]
ISITSTRLTPILRAKLAFLASEYCIYNLSSFLTPITRALHNIDTTHKVMVYAGSTSSSAPRMHAFTHHTELYLEAAEHFGWHIQIKDLNERLAEGWSLMTIREHLKKLYCTMQSLGPPS